MLPARSWRSSASKRTLYLGGLDPSLGGAHTELLFCVDLPSPALGVDTNRALGRAIVDQVDRRRVTGWIGAIRDELRRRLALSRLMARDDQLPRAGGKKRLAAYLRRRMLGGSNASEEPDREDKSQRHHDGILHRHGPYTRGRHCASLRATCQLETRLHARAPRVELSTRGVIPVHVPWAAPPGGRGCARRSRARVPGVRVGLSVPSVTTSRSRRGPRAGATRRRTAARSR